MSVLCVCFKILCFTLMCMNICYCETDTSPKVVIDNDAGGDDAMAIFLALLNEKHYNGSKLIGLTTANGNTNEDNVCRNNQRILKVAKRQDVPIYRGCKESMVTTPAAGDYFGKDGLGDSGEVVTGLVEPKETGAVAALIELSKTYEGKYNCFLSTSSVSRGPHPCGGFHIKHTDVATADDQWSQDASKFQRTILDVADSRYRSQLTVITLGTLTNVAMALKLDPNFLNRISQLHIGAGHIHGEDTPDPEFNALMDVEAYHLVLQHATPDKVTIFPFSQAIRYLNFSREWREGVLGAINTEIIKAQNLFEKVSLKSNDRWQALDPAAVAIALKPDLVEEYKYSKYNITVCGSQRGINTNEFVDKKDANVRIAYSVKKEVYRQFLLDIFALE